MLEDDIDIEKYISRSFRLLFMLFLFFVIFTTDSYSSEKQNILHIEHVETSFSEIKSLQQNTQISLNTKRRTNINSISPNILNTYTTYNFFWCNVKQNILFEYLKVLLLKKDIILLYCVLLI